MLGYEHVSWVVMIPWKFTWNLALVWPLDCLAWVLHSLLEREVVLWQEQYLLVEWLIEFCGENRWMFYFWRIRSYLCRGFRILCTSCCRVDPKSNSSRLEIPESKTILRRDTGRPFTKISKISLDLRYWEDTTQQFTMLSSLWSVWRYSNTLEESP